MIWPFHVIPAHIFRCEGRTFRVMGQPTLDEGCVDCARRTLDRSADDIKWLQTPTAPGPCPARMPEELLEGDE